MRMACILPGRNHSLSAYFVLIIGPMFDVVGMHLYTISPQRYKNKLS